MSLSAATKSMSGKTILEVHNDMQKLYAAMPPERFVEHINNLLTTAKENGRDQEREEIVCRLLANGMTVDEIAVVLCVKKEFISIIEYNNSSVKIPDYAKKLSVRRRRRKTHVN